MNQFPMTSLPFHRQPTSEQLEAASFERTELELGEARGSTLETQALWSQGEPHLELTLSQHSHTLWANLTLEEAEALHTSLTKFLELGGL